MSTIEYFRVIIFLTLVFGVYVAEAHVLIEWLRHRREDHSRAIRLGHPAAVLVHVLAVLGVVCMLYGYFVEPYWLEVSRVQIRTDKLSQTRFRIVHISDLHCDPTPRNEEKLDDIINPFDPDIIVFTGDAVNSREAVPLFRRTLRSLNARLGKFAVRGNIDLGGARHWDQFKESGFKLLDSDTVIVRKEGEEIALRGLGPAETPSGSRLAGDNDDTFTVYLHHYPSLVEEVKGPRTDLFLCGHVHGGQIALPGYGALMTLSSTGKKYESGRYEVGATTMYVSRGIGMEGGTAPRVRFWARPEVGIIDVLPESP
ncbi:MAG: metallophosphoesterase [Planctomycetota bacterium]